MIFVLWRTKTTTSNTFYLSMTLATQRASPRQQTTTARPISSGALSRSDRDGPGRSLLDCCQVRCTVKESGQTICIGSVLPSKTYVPSTDSAASSRHISSHTPKTKLEFSTTIFVLVHKEEFVSLRMKVSNQRVFHILGIRPVKVVGTSRGRRAQVQETVCAEPSNTQTV